MITQEEFIETIKQQHRILRRAANCLDNAEYAMHRRVDTGYESKEAMAKDILAGAMASSLEVYNNLTELYSQQINYEV